MSPAAKSGSARAVADVTHGTILASVEIAATPERVYRALTSADEIPRWWGSAQAYRTTKWTSELRVGGVWRAEGVAADGAPFHVEGEYLQLDVPHTIVQTWKPSWDGGHVTKLTYRIEPTQSGARVTVRHEGFAERAESCRGHAAGWEQVLSWLSGHAAPPTAASFFLCKLIPPRPSFALDMNAEERAVMQAHAAYWTEHLRAGRAIVFGPVHDPQGPWGLGVVRAPDLDAVRRFEAGDPAIRSGRGFRYEILPMLTAVVAD
jgi:uncharacterized protein YndB with AHSA1/START domain/uncharacterized protein YciI